MKKASVLLALILSGTSSLAWAGVCVLDAPDCACFKDTGAWNPSGDLLTVAAQTLGTTESCTKDGGKPFYQMQSGISDRSEAQILSFSKIFVGRRPWCSETVAYWHLEARVPYDRGYGGVWWHPSWQMASTDNLRSWYKAEEGLGGRARWIDATELDLRNFSPGINAPCPGAYQQIMGYEPNPFGLPSWSLPWLSPWEGTSNAHSQVVESMVLYYFNDDLVGDVVDFDLQMIEGNAGAGGKVINTRVHARAARYTPQGGDSPDDFIGNGRKIRGWGIDRDANGDPLCAYDRITKKRWPYQFVPEYDSDPHIEVDKYDEYQISKYRQFQRAIEANDGLRVRINQANPSYYTLPTGRDPWVIELVDGKADILVGFPLPLPYPFGSVEIHFEGRHRPDEMSARALNNRADAKRGGHRMSAWQRLDEGTGRAILEFSGPTTAADILFQLIGGIEPGHAAKIVVSALYFHPYVDLSREDSDHNPAPPPAADPTAAMLELFLKGELPAAELAITYSDLHQLHGGLELTIHGDGTVEQQVLREEPGEPHDLSRAQVEELVRLLLEFEVWEQRVPERMPVPDESRAYLKVAAGEVESEIWEWHNDLEAGDRLIRIRKRMKQLAWR